MYQTARNKNQFLDQYVNVTQRLSCFEDITAAKQETSDPEADAKAWGLVKDETQAESTASSNGELSDGEFPEL